MSISVPLAVTMMMGTLERVRMVRHTSMPDILGSIRSSRRMSGAVSSKSCSASLPSRATVTRNPSLVRPMTSASMKDSSSSASRTLTGPSPGAVRALFLAAALPDRGLGHATRSAWIGSTSVKVEPSPSRDSTSTQPWWLLATWRTMDRPRPVPPVSRLRPWSTR